MVAKKQLVDLDLQTVAKVLNVPTPSSSGDAVNKGYVDAAASGAINSKPSVAAVATSNVTLSAPQTIDGVVLSAGQRVLLTAQSTASQNGIWVVAAGSWTRPTDWATASNQVGGYVFVEAGTVNASSGWIVSGAAAITVDTTSETWVQFTGAGEVTAGTGLSKSGNALSLATPVTTANGGTGSATAAGARTNLGATGKFASTFGDGSSTSYTINHNLGTTDVIVQVWTVTSPALEDVVVTITDGNNVVIQTDSAPAASSLRAVVVG